MKTCTRCKIEKDLNSFPRYYKDSTIVLPACRECRRLCQIKYREKNPEKTISYSVKYQKQNKQAVKAAIRRHRLKKKFGITVEQYEDKLMEQNGVCAICKKVCKSGRLLAVDHNHSTNKNRGLLCANCNIGIGHLQEDFDIIQSAVEYLKKYASN